MTTTTIKHRARCRARQERVALWEARWPAFCRSCGATGESVFWEHHPYGSTTAAERLVEPCPTCLDSDRCPRCGLAHSLIEVARVTDDENWDTVADLCSACGWLGSRAGEHQRDHQRPYNPAEDVSCGCESLTVFLDVTGTLTDTDGVMDIQMVQSVIRAWAHYREVHAIIWSANPERVDGPAEYISGAFRRQFGLVPDNLVIERRAKSVETMRDLLRQHPDGLVVDDDRMIRDLVAQMGIDVLEPGQFARTQWPAVFG